MVDGTFLTIHRPAGWQNKLRAYDVVVDGQVVAKLRDGQSTDVPVAAGPHRVQLKIDWCTSPELTVDVRPGAPVALTCGKGTRTLLTLWDTLFRSSQYLSLEQVVPTSSTL